MAISLSSNVSSEEGDVFEPGFLGCGRFMLVGGCFERVYQRSCIDAIDDVDTCAGTAVDATTWSSPCLAPRISVPVDP
jgi:hypothetical protein